MKDDATTSDAPQDISAEHLDALLSAEAEVGSMKVSALRRLLHEELAAALRKTGIPPTPAPIVSAWRPPPANVQPDAQEGTKAIAQNLERQRAEVKRHREQERKFLRERQSKARRALLAAEEKCVATVHSMIPGETDEVLENRSISFIDTYIRPIVESMVCRSVVTFVIVANTMFIYFFTDELMRYESGQVTDWWIGYQVGEDFFLIFYCVEICFRILTQRSHFLINQERNWNVFDFALTATGLIIRLSEASRVDPEFLRVIRLAKIVKILRSFNVVRQLTALRVLLNCLLGTIWELFWSMSMMAVVFFMFSTVLVQLVSRQIHLADDEGFRDILEFFGSEGRAMFSLYKATTGGDDWSMYYDLLVSVSTACGVVFLAVICFAQVSLLNIVTGLFIDQAMAYAEPDATARAITRAEDNLRLFDALEELAERINEEGKDEINITKHKFCKAVNEEMELRNKLEVLGLDIADTEAFFDLLLESQGFAEGEALSVGDFVSGCLTLKGKASARDIIALTGSVKLIIARQDRCVEILSELMGEVRDKGDFTV
jgi:hypothetical protein